MQLFHENKAGKALLIFLLLSILLFIGGCAGMREGARKGDLNFAVNDYLQSIRWGLLARALVYIPHDQQDYFIKTAEKVFDNVSIADIEVRAILPNEQITNAKVMLTIGIYTKDNLKLVTVKQVQHWQKIKDHWYIMDPDLEIFLKKLNMS